MANNVVHFAIHADDVDRAQAFYTAVFGWRFEAWGPPGFFNIVTGPEDDPGIMGALHEREVELELEGRGFAGFECTVGVEDIDAIAELVVTNRGTITYGPAEIPTVGTVLQFVDTERNTLSAMEYGPTSADPGGV